MHRQKYLEGIAKAKLQRDNRDAVKERYASEEQRAADEVAKILLDRHRAKVAKIVIERPYLKNQEDSGSPVEPLSIK